MPKNEPLAQEGSNEPSLPVANAESEEHAPTKSIANDELNASEDINPRSPKRRRLSPKEEDETFDIGAAAARALALSLGKDISEINVPTNLSTALANGVNHAPNSINNGTLSAEQMYQSRLDGLPMLHDLALKVLQYLAKLNHLEIGEMLFGPPSPRSQEYRVLRQKFDDAKKPYIIGSSPFIPPYALNSSGSEEVDMIRRINLAIFMASIFSGEIGLRIMDINFLDVFVPEGGRLLKAQGAIYLELKTHAFMAATRTASTMLSQVMTDLFPPDMDKLLLQKRPGAKTLAPSEQDFLNRLGSRRDILYSVIRSSKLNTLPDTYRWNDFAREVSLYLTKHMENGNSVTKDGLDVALPIADAAQVHQDQMESQFSVDPLPIDMSSKAMLASAPGISDQGSSLELPFDIEAMVGQAARAAALSMGANIDMSLLPSPSFTSLQTPQPEHPSLPAATVAETSTVGTSSTPSASNSEIKTQFQIYEPTQPAVNTNGTDVEAGSSEIPHSSQTAPTQVLYERARQVTTSKVLNSKKMAPPIHRRPWTTDEENALMTGLDQVKGPHWSQILAMYGPGGTINESLKDRNQVQLKDKARNLKLFFLKAGIEVPYYLQAVTGDLRTRAPGQAEKMERDKLQGEGERTLQDGSNGVVELSDLAEVEGDLETEVEAEAEEEIDTAMDSSHTGCGEAEEPLAISHGQDLEEFDMEAIIAQAAASASQGLPPPS